MPLSSDISVLGSYWEAVFEAAKAGLGLTDVWYGDQIRIPRTPCLCIETGPTLSELSGAPYRMMHTFTIYFMLYVAKIQDEQVTRLTADQKMEQIKTVLHADHQMGAPPNNLVIHGHVSAREPGFAHRGGSLMRAARVTWTGMSKTNE